MFMKPPRQPPRSWNVKNASRGFHNGSDTAKNGKCRILNQLHASTPSFSRSLCKSLLP